MTAVLICLFSEPGISKKHKLTGGPAWAWTGIAALAEPAAGSGSDACEEREKDRGSEIEGRKRTSVRIVKTNEKCNARRTLKALRNSVGMTFLENIDLFLGEWGLVFVQ